MSKLAALIIVFIILLMLVPKMSKNLLQTNKFLTPIPTSKAFPPPKSADLESFTYPNSKIVSSNTNTLVLESNDSANTVTDWYKQHIKTEGMNATSYVTTNTNGNILNKLAGSSSYKKIDVEIRKQNSQPAVRMTIYVN